MTTAMFRQAADFANDPRHHQLLERAGGPEGFLALMALRGWAVCHGTNRVPACMQGPVLAQVGLLNASYHADLINDVVGAGYAVRIGDDVELLDLQPVTPAEVRAEQTGFVYFVRAGDVGGPIKVGFATNVAARIAALQTGSPVELHLLATMPGTLQTERELHQQLAGLRVRGEWFVAAPEFLRFIALLRPGSP